MNPGETGEQWRERVMQVDVNMTLSVKAPPVQLRRHGLGLHPPRNATIVVHSTLPTLIFSFYVSNTLVGQELVSDSGGY